jgi:hypothetical protein
MYYCLVDLSNILDSKRFSLGYTKAEDFQEDCFKTLATAIEAAFAKDEKPLVG